MSILILGGLVLLVVAAMVQASRPLWPSQGRITRVPVDDFVVGDLPMICARTGRPADGLVGVESAESTFQTWWLLLLFLGPLGIVAIVLLWTLARRPARVGGSVPMTHEALADQNRVVRLANWAWAVPVVFLLAGGALLFAPPRYFRWLPFTPESVGVVVLLGALVGGFVAMAVIAGMANSRQVTVRLDGTGRWVEIRNVNVDFARATDSEVRRRHEAARNRTPR